MCNGYSLALCDQAASEKWHTTELRRESGPMSALGGGLNRSTQHSISFYLLGFEPQGLARTASDAKVPGFSAAVKPRKNPRRFVTHSIFPLQDRECCVDRLNRPFKSGHVQCNSACPLCATSGHRLGSLDHLVGASEQPRWHRSFSSVRLSPLLDQFCHHSQIQTQTTRCSNQY